MLVTKDGVNFHKQFSADEGISYTLLADPKADIIDTFGWTKWDDPKSSAWYGIAILAIYIVNAIGKTSRRFLTENYLQRPDVDRVLDTLGKQ